MNQKADPQTVFHHVPMFARRSREDGHRSVSAFGVESLQPQL